MKHPVSVEELLELHRLGELYLKWVSNPVAMSDEDLGALEHLSDLYGITGTTALFAFQKQYQEEFGLSGERTVGDVARAALNELKEFVADSEPIMLTPRDRFESMLTQRWNGVEIDLGEAWNLAEHLGQTFEQFHNKIFQKAGQLWLAEKNWFAAKEAQLDAQERNTAVIEAVHEDNELDRESQAEHRANQLREFREQLEGEMNEAREIEILLEISNVDELTENESDRLDEWMRRKRNSDSGTHKIPTGILAQAIRGNEKGN